MTYLRQLMSDHPVSAFGFTDDLEIVGDRGLLSNERQGDLGMWVTAPDIAVDDVRTVSLDNLLSTIITIDRQSNGWRARCQASLFCHGVDSYIHAITIGHTWRVDELGIVLSFNRIFSPAPDFDATRPPMDYLPITTFVKCLVDLYGEDRVEVGNNILFSVSGPDSKSACVAWFVIVKPERGERLWPLMISMRNQILCVEETYASRLTVGDAIAPRSATDLLLAGRALNRIERLAFKDQYDVELTDHIDSGGVGHLYVGTRSNGQRIALKVLAPDLRFDVNDETRSRFQEEHEILRIIGSLGVAPTAYEYGICVGRNFFAQEYIPWENMKSWAFGHDRTMAERIRVLRSAIKAVSLMHTAGIVHRDLSPKNLLVDPNGVEVKIVDFGVALRSDHRQCVSDPVGGARKVGSLKYSAPEVRESPTNASFASDVFSLGIIIYEITLGRQIAGNVPPLSDVLRDFPEDVSKFAATAVRFDPHERPSATNFPSSH